MQRTWVTPLEIVNKTGQQRQPPWPFIAYLRREHRPKSSSVPVVSVVGINHSNEERQRKSDNGCTYQYAIGKIDTQVRPRELIGETDEKRRKEKVG